ncbi:Poly(U)-specific endoribonuclease-B [Morella rubra]|uniref:Poly(U)-specific endoribonuclease-B n=1 Tax=Morella rubra TaxID=262757 RepID=A0A6A1VYS3_9ROSI|nr:Poly(U)-specific endoribonuclease-B [Morella rubra]
MDGLIKGLIDVVLGHNDRDDEEREPQAGEERSRSTWAQVVSGEPDQDEEGSNRTHDHTQNRWSRQEKSEFGSEEWEATGSRPSRWPQKTVDEGYEKVEDVKRHDYDQSSWKREDNEEERNDSWETVSEKPRRRPHKIQMDHWHEFRRPPSEQEYSDEVESGAYLEPAEEELADLSQACNKLWDLDMNRLVPGKDYEIDCGEGKKVYQKTIWHRKPVQLGERRYNYNPDEGCREVVTSEERQEQAAFIEEISKTAPIKYLHKYLSSKGIISENYQYFKRTMTSLWFDLYRRGGTSGSSSSFEHVFVGEIKQRGEKEVSGFHNWLQFYLEEAKGRVNYQGYIFPRRRGQIPDSDTQLLTVQFEWNGVLKSVSSTLIGVSPEFEIALYTLCFYVGEEDNHVELGPYPVDIKCYRLGDRIGSAFPVAEC